MTITDPIPTTITSLIKSPTNKAVSGGEMASFLLDKFQADYPDAAQDAMKNDMFREMITRQAFDVAGNRFSLNEDGTYASGFDQLFKELAEQGIVGRDAFEHALNLLPTYTKGYVQTPHPTEVLTGKAIAAEQALHTGIEHNKDLFNGRLHTDIAPEALSPELQKMRKLYEELTPLDKQMTPEQEMMRSVIFSERMFDAVPIIVQAFLDAAKRAGAYQGEALTPAQLSRFNFLLSPETWSPGDRDSKDQMTAALIQQGVEMNKKAIFLHYIQKLAEIAVSEETKGEMLDGTPVKNEICHIMWRVMQNIPSDQVQELVAKGANSNVSPPAFELIKLMHEVRHTMPSARDKAKVEKLRALGVDVTSQKDDDLNYERLRDFYQNLAALVTTPGATFPKYTLENGRKSDLNQLEVLSIQANSFGHVALHPQIRQNAKMHEGVMNTLLNTLLKTLSERGVKIEGHDPETYAKADVDTRRRVTEALLDLVMDPNKGSEIHRIIKEKIEHIKSSAQQEDVDFRETLNGFGVAAKNARAITHYLIAECRSDVDMLEAFTLLKAMEPDKDRHDYKRAHVEITPLFEHRADVENSPDIVVEAFKNRHFREHHNFRPGGLEQMIDLAQPTVGEKSLENLEQGGRSFNLNPQMPVKRMTVAEAKKMFGLTVKEGDDKKYIVAVKTVMYAGSDITKSAGCAGAGLVLHTTAKMRERMLDMQDPVLLIDYTGAGGGLHRSQPVATSLETVQGRSMRQGPESAAGKAMLTLSRTLLRRGGGGAIQPDKESQVTLAQLNLGNMTGLALTDDNWNKMQDRLAADMKRYQDLYHSQKFSNYFSYTANEFAKLTSFAARSAARVGAKSSADQFPPGVDVENLRAIGYGAALNVSGSCASLYYGVTEFLKLDEQGNIPEFDQTLLKDLYLSDPITQDRINRATFGVVMADMDAAFQYFGITRKREADGKVSYEDPKTVRSDREKAAIKVLQDIDREYQRASKGLLQLQCMVKNSPYDANKPEAEQLLAGLPKALREQLTASRQHIKPARDFLAKRFNQALEGTENLPKKDVGDQQYQQIYYAMGTLFECFENAARAYTRPHWAQAVEAGKTVEAAVN